MKKEWKEVLLAALCAFCGSFPVAVVLGKLCDRFIHDKSSIMASIVMPFVMACASAVGGFGLLAWSANWYLKKHSDSIG